MIRAIKGAYEKEGALGFAFLAVLSMFALAGILLAATIFICGFASVAFPGVCHF